MNMDSWTTMRERFPWLDAVEEIAEDQGFFHWELRFASVFAEGGFDIQVGNPPWVRPEWEENVVLAELEPWFELVRSLRPLTKPPNNGTTSIRIRTEVASRRARWQAGISEFFGSIATYPVLDGTSRTSTEPSW